MNAIYIQALRSHVEHVRDTRGDVSVLDPHTVLKLLDHVERVERDRDEWQRKALASLTTQDLLRGSITTWRERADRAEAALQKLTAESLERTALHMADLDNATRRIKELQAEPGEPS